MVYLLLGKGGMLGAVYIEVVDLADLDFGFYVRPTRAAGCRVGPSRPTLQACPGALGIG